jgi:protein-S-isoprenylcysteine O-methyltransferase Ste14
MALAQALLLPNWVAGPGGLFGFGLLFALRIGPEERMMEEAFGDEYRAYRDRSWRIIPYIY